jgi:hypothetical protein
MRDRKLTTLEEADVIAEADREASSLAKRAALDL